MAKGFDHLLLFFDRDRMPDEDKSKPPSLHCSRLDSSRSVEITFSLVLQAVYAAYAEARRHRKWTEYGLSPAAKLILLPKRQDAPSWLPGMGEGKANGSPRLECLANRLKSGCEGQWTRWAFRERSGKVPLAKSSLIAPFLGQCIIPQQLGPQRRCTKDTGRCPVFLVLWWAAWLTGDRKLAALLRASPPDRRLCFL